MLGYITNQSAEGDGSVDKRLEQYAQYGYTSENPLEDILSNGVYAIAHYFGESLDKTSQMLNWTWDKISTTIENYLDKKVMWVVHSDNACEYCIALNDKVFKIRNVPPKHPHCHCGLAIVDDNTPETAPYPGDNPYIAPNGYGWRGPGSQGSREGSYYNPDDGTVLSPDLNHPEPIAPHWDYKDENGIWWRLYKDGSIELK